MRKVVGIRNDRRKGNTNLIVCLIKDAKTIALDVIYECNNNYVLIMIV